MWLLLFPSVFRTLYFFESTFAIISFVLVFPTLPVTPTTFKLYFFLCISILYFAISPIAFTVSSTKIIFLFLYSFLFSSVIFILFKITVFAPFFIASSQKRFPSKFSPFIAIYVSPFFIVLVSLE